MKKIYEKIKQRQDKQKKELLQIVNVEFEKYFKLNSTYLELKNKISETKEISNIFNYFKDKYDFKYYDFLKINFAKDNQTYFTFDYMFFSNFIFEVQTKFYNLEETLDETLENKNYPKLFDEIDKYISLPQNTLFYKEIQFFHNEVQNFNKIKNKNNTLEHWESTFNNHKNLILKKQENKINVLIKRKEKFQKYFLFKNKIKELNSELIKEKQIYQTLKKQLDIDLDSILKLIDNEFKYLHLNKNFKTNFIITIFENNLLEKLKKMLEITIITEIENSYANFNEILEKSFNKIKVFYLDTIDFNILNSFIEEIWNHEIFIKNLFSKNIDKCIEIFVCYFFI